MQRIWHCSTAVATAFWDLSTLAFLLNQNAWKQANKPTSSIEIIPSTVACSRCVLTLLDHSVAASVCICYWTQAELFDWCLFYRMTPTRMFSGMLLLQEFELLHHGALLDEWVFLSRHPFFLGGANMFNNYSCFVWTHLALCLQFKHFCAPFLVINVTCTSFSFLLVNLTKAVKSYHAVLAAYAVVTFPQPNNLVHCLKIQPQPSFQDTGREEPDPLSECHSNGL